MREKFRTFGSFSILADSHADDRQQNGEQNDDTNHDTRNDRNSAVGRQGWQFK